jgi:hypothetical protein
MSTYEVRFIQNSSAQDDTHIVQKVEAHSHEDALTTARDMAKNVAKLSEFQFWSVEITRLSPP